MKESVGYLVIDKNKDYMKIAKELNLVGLKVFNCDTQRILKFDRMNEDKLNIKLSASEFYFRVGDKIHYLTKGGLMKTLDKSAFVGTAVVKNNDGTTRNESYDCYKFEQQLEALTGEREGKAKAVQEFANNLVDIKPKIMDIF